MEQDHRIDSSSTDALEKRTVEKLLNILSAYKYQHDVLQHRIVELEEQIASINVELNKTALLRDIYKYRMERREKQLQQRGKQLYDAYQQLLMKDQAIERILSGTIMQLQMKFGRLMDGLIPSGTPLRGVYNWLLKLMNSMIINKKKAVNVKAIDRNHVLPAAFKGNAGESLTSFLKDPNRKLYYPAYSKPEVSIVILTYNNACYTYDCLQSILTKTKIPYEMIIVDNASSDETSLLLQRLINVRIILNKINLGFIEGCNMGAAAATTNYLLFLNNDTIVTDGWLESLYNTIEKYPQCGAVGSKLLQLDGKLQEAGSMVFADGSTLGYGRDDDPNKPEYCYLREVDYCSGCCLLVQKRLFDDIGGFDKRYGLAYYEDVDLCMAIWERGYKVLYQPSSVIYHLEYRGSSPDKAVSLMQRNRIKFLDKWRDKLALNLDNNSINIVKMRDKRDGMRILIVDDRIPSASIGMGFPRAEQLLNDIAGLGYCVTFFPVDNQNPIQPNTVNWQQAGIEIMYGDLIGFEDFIIDRSGYYDIVIISRPHNMRNYYDVIKRFSPEAVIIYDAEAIFAMRDILKAEIFDKPIEKEALLNEEVSLIQKADIILTVSKTEKSIIHERIPDADVEVWGYAMKIAPGLTGFREREDILFVGSFLAGEGSPNEDAALYFTRQIFPIIRDELNCRLHIIGMDPTKAIRELADESVKVHGFVDDIKPYYEKCKLFIVSTRYAAGIPLKLIEAMCHGIPAVVTPLIASQLELTDNIEVLVAADAKEFAVKCIELYNNEELWNKLKSNMIDYAGKNFNPDELRHKLQELLRKATDLKNGRKSTLV